VGPQIGVADWESVRKVLTSLGQESTAELEEAIQKLQAASKGK
jgi:predicted lactoylglutathione lyase